MTLRRVEALSGPAGVLTDGVCEALAREAGARGLDARAVDVRVGEQRVVVFVPREDAGSVSGGRVTEGRWPEPLGLVVEAGAAGWRVEPDVYAMRPLFWAETESGGVIVSTRAGWVAGLTGARLSRDGVLERLLVSFSLDDRSVFEGVRRVRSGEWLEGDGRAWRVGSRAVESEGIVRRRRDVTGEADGWIDELAREVAGWFERGHVLELTGGLDSRLVLALGMRGGARPRWAFTLGEEGAEEVELARLVCATAGIEHRRVDPPMDSGRLVEDAREMVGGSGHSVDAGSYAFLPGLFRRMEGSREGQVGGAAGSPSSYYTPFDHLCGLRWFQEQWAARRLVLSGIRAGELYGEARAGEGVRGVIGTALGLLDAREGTWRQRTDWFFVTQRLRQWAGGVVSASALWYDAEAPLLSRPFVEWGWSLPARYRRHRRGQMELTWRLEARIGALPYTGGYRRPAGVVGVMEEKAKRGRAVSRSVWRRFVRKTPKMDMTAGDAVGALVGDEGLRVWFVRACEEAGVREEGVVKMLREPDGFVREAGALITAAYALEERERVARAAGLSGGGRAA